jgi:hypothetical protein
LQIGKFASTPLAATTFFLLSPTRTTFFLPGFPHASSREHGSFPPMAAELHFLQAGGSLPRTVSLPCAAVSISQQLQAPSALLFSLLSRRGRPFLHGRAPAPAPASGRGAAPLQRMRRASSHGAHGAPPLGQPWHGALPAPPASDCSRELPLLPWRPPLLPPASRQQAASPWPSSPSSHGAQKFFQRLPIHLSPSRDAQIFSSREPLPMGATPPATSPCRRPEIAAACSFASRVECSTKCRSEQRS